MDADRIRHCGRRRPDARPVAPLRRRRARRPHRSCSSSVLLLGSLGGGFLWFVYSVPTTETAPSRNADGIVALTGGPFRINDALDLLAAGRGKRLLISGVNPATRAARNLAAGARASALVLPAASISIIPPPTPSATRSKRGAGRERAASGR